MHLWRAGTQLEEAAEREEVTFFENWKSALIWKKYTGLAHLHFFFL